jgi:hypothetical protein
MINKKFNAMILENQTPYADPLDDNPRINKTERATKSTSVSILNNSFIPLPHFGAGEYEKHPYSPLVLTFSVH